MYRRAGLDQGHSGARSFGAHAPGGGHGGPIASGAGRWGGALSHACGPRGASRTGTGAQRAFRTTPAVFSAVDRGRIRWLAQ